MKKVKIKVDAENFKIIVYSPDTKFKNVEEFIRWLQPSIPDHADINSKVKSIFYRFDVLEDNMFVNGNIIEIKLEKPEFNNENISNYKINYITELLYELSKAARDIDENYSVISTEEEIAL